jgi:hypothetical protein
MHRHNCFDLWLHDDGELAPLVQSNILERVTLHEWPLSCVQRLTTADGRRLIYKTQFGPTVEPEFYANARSGLLASAETIYQADGHACMLIEFVQGPLLKDLDLPEAEIVRIGRTVMDQIAGIAGHLPYLLDVSTEQRWGELADATLRDLSELISQGKFRLVDGEMARNLEQWAFSKPVLAAVGMNPGYIHGDLTGDNLFVRSDGYRVIDWQRPMMGPADLDLATLMSGFGFNPARTVDESIVQMMVFLRIHHLARCAVRWIPQSVGDYDVAIARLATLIGKRRVL